MQFLELDSMIKAKPFQPFLMRTTDGQSFRADHPEWVVPTPDKRSVVFFEPGDPEDEDTGYRFTIVDLRLVTTLEPARSGPRRRKSQGKRRE